MGQRSARGESRARAVLAWAALHGRDLPWRHTRDPWAVLVSEMMAQQTQVDRVIPKWIAFMERWPTFEAFAAASLGDVLREWEGLGYPRRAKHLHQTAQQLAGEGLFPHTLMGLQLLPGVGPYTARAVLAFAFEQDVAVVDTNTARLLARWENRTLNRRDVQAAADEAVPEGKGWAWNQAMLDLGALVCTRRAPKCSQCPVLGMCAYGLAVTPATAAGYAIADPADGTAGVSVVQSRFEGSDRQYRGRILRLARLAGEDRPISDISALIGLDHDPDRALRLVDGLVAEGLAVVSDGRVTLPGKTETHETRAQAALHPTTSRGASNR